MTRFLNSNPTLNAIREPRSPTPLKPQRPTRRLNGPSTSSMRMFVSLRTVLRVVSCILIVPFEMSIEARRSVGEVCSARAPVPHGRNPGKCGTSSPRAKICAGVKATMALRSTIFKLPAPRRPSRHLGILAQRTVDSPHMAKTAEKLPPIAVNRKARFDYFIEERFEAGISLLGWEVKSMRAGKAQIAEAYVYLRDGEAFLFGAHINALNSASTHVDTVPTRTRKLLLTRRQLDHLVGAVERRGHTLVPLELYWKEGRAKLEIGLAKGKKQHDKRANEQDRDWQRDKGRIMKALRR